MLDDTIAAIATPLGNGGLAIIRISGGKALTIADTLFAPGGKSKHRLPVSSLTRCITVTSSGTTNGWMR